MSNDNIVFIRDLMALPESGRIGQHRQMENIARNNWLREFLERVGKDGIISACAAHEDKINEDTSGQGSGRMKKRGTRRKRRVRKRSNGKTRGRSRGRSLRRTRGRTRGRRGRRGRKKAKRGRR